MHLVIHHCLCTADFALLCSPQVSRPKSQTLRVEKGSGAAPVPVVEAISRGSTPATSPARTVTPKRTPEALGASMSGGSKGSSPMSDSKPAFVEHAGKRLQFTAWTAEAVHESAAETARIRHYVITYFPEDGSLMVTEPPVANSGLPGASILRRSHVPKKALAPPEEASFVSLPGDSGDAAAGPGETVGPQDIHIGEHLSLYGRVYHVASATPFTRTWLAEQMGIELAPDEPLPADPYTAAKEASMRRDAGFTGTLSSLRGVAVGGAGGSPGGFDGSRSGGFAASGGGSGHGTPGSSTYHGREMTSIKRFLEASRGSTSAVLTKGVRDKTAQWRAHDSRDALKFKGIIDERDKEGGLRLPVTVAYYLADDAVEVTIVRSPGDGLGRFSCLWKRAPLPKGLIWHDSRPRDVESDKGEEDYVTADDLRVGSTLHLMGRTVLLHDADEETYEWYARNRGLDMRGGAVDVTERPPPAPVAPLPPKLPYGTEEDSLGSVYSLQPKRPKTDWKRVWALDGQKIAFHARLAEVSHSLGREPAATGAAASSPMHSSLIDRVYKLYYWQLHDGAPVLSLLPCSPRPLPTPSVSSQSRLSWRAARWPFSSLQDQTQATLAAIFSASRRCVILTLGATSPPRTSIQGPS